MKQDSDAILSNLSIVRRFLSRALVSLASVASTFVVAASFTVALGQETPDGAGAGTQGTAQNGAAATGGASSAAASGRVGATQTTSQNVAEAQLALYYRQDLEKDANGATASLGESLTLERLLYGVYSPAERARRLYAYWELSYKFAYYNLCKQTQGDVDACFSKVVNKYGGSASVPETAVAYLNAARQIATERATSARLNLLQAQYNFDATFSSAAGRRAALARAAATGRRVDGDSVLYAPTTPPATAAYRTRFEEMSLYRRLPEEAARLNALLPLLYETLQSRASQAGGARRALLSAFNAATLPQNDDALFNLVDAFFAAQNEALKAAARYNQAIAAYVAQTVPGNVQGEALLATLNQRPTSATRSTATPAAGQQTQGASGQGAGAAPRPQNGVPSAFYPIPINRIPDFSDRVDPNEQAPTALVAVDLTPSYGLLLTSFTDADAPRISFAAFETENGEAPVTLQATGEITPLSADVPKAEPLTAATPEAAPAETPPQPAPQPSPETTPQPAPQPTPEPKAAEPKTEEPAPQPVPEPKAETPAPKPQEGAAPEKPADAPKPEAPAPAEPPKEPKEERPPIVTQSTPPTDEVLSIFVFITGYEQPQKSESTQRVSDSNEAPDGAFLPQERDEEFASFFDEMLAEAVANSNLEVEPQETSRIERGQSSDAAADSGRASANENSEAAAAKRAYAATRALFAVPIVDPSAQIEGEEERLFSLYEVAARSGSTPAARNAVAKTYWRLSGAVARIRVEETIAQHYARLLTIARNANSEAATTACVSAIFEAQARTGEAKALKRVEQTNLLRMMGLTIATSSYPLPSTTPFCGMKYELGAAGYETAARRGAGELVLERLKLTREAGANFRSPAVILGFDFTNVTDADVELAIAALKKQREQALLFVDLVVALNCSIADYAAYFPARANSDRFVESLVGR